MLQVKTNGRSIMESIDVLTTITQYYISNSGLTKMHELPNRLYANATRVSWKPNITREMH